MTRDIGYIGDKKIGRPKKYYEEVGNPAKNFYFPMTAKNSLVWNEFVRVCSKSENISIYAKVKSTRKNIFLRQSIYKSVILHSTNKGIKDVALELLLRDMNERIIKYNKDNKKNVELTSMEALKEKFDITPIDGDDMLYGLPDNEKVAKVQRGEATEEAIEEAIEDEAEDEAIEDEATEDEETEEVEDNETAINKEISTW